MEATFTKTLTIPSHGSSGEDFVKLLQQLTTQGDNYQRVVIVMKAPLSEEKRGTICEELLNHFSIGVPSLEKMIPSIQFLFTSPFPQLPSSLAKIAQSKDANNAVYNHNNTMAGRIPEIHGDMRWKLRNQHSGEGFFLQISVGNHLLSATCTLSIQRIDTKEEPAAVLSSSQMMVVADQHSVSNNFSISHSSTGEEEEEEIVIVAKKAKRPRELDENNTHPGIIPPSSTTPTTGVGDLYAAGLLGRALLQHLPWRKRVQVQGVCRRWQREALVHGGWADVHRLEWGERTLERGIRLGPVSWRQLLSRAGPSLTTLSLENVSRRELNVGELCAGLAKLPKLKHLCIRREHLTRRSLDLILREHASRLRSLKLDCNGMGSGKVFDNALYQLLYNLPMLEFLSIGGWLNEHMANSNGGGGVMMSAASLSNLRNLTIHCKGALFNEASLTKLVNLATSTSLRSLTLMATVDNLAHLRHFTHLEYLDIVGDENSLQASFFGMVLPQLRGSLKALRVRDLLSVASLEHLATAIVTHLPRLEHLGLGVQVLHQGPLMVQGPPPGGGPLQGAPPGAEATEKAVRLLGSLASLKSLRSLAVAVYLPSTYSSAPEESWGWLKEILQHRQHQLEYLEVWGEVPLATLCSIVRHGGRSLRALKSGTSVDQAGLHELVKAAASSNLGENEGKGEKEEEEPMEQTESSLKKSCGGPPSPPPSPILRIAFPGAERLLEYGSSRLRFVPLEAVCSPVLLEHRYGCLSEGRPEFLPHSDD